MIRTPADICVICPIFIHLPLYKKTLYIFFIFIVVLTKVLWWVLFHYFSKLQVKAQKEDGLFKTPKPKDVALKFNPICVSVRFMLSINKRQIFWKGLYLCITYRIKTYPRGLFNIYMCVLFCIVFRDNSTWRKHWEKWIRNKF